MKLGSLFDGSGTCPLAAVMCGIEPVWASEIEKFPIEVTTKRFPNMKHLGNILNINGAEIEPVDIITFGSPCTNLSVAGKQNGFTITFTCCGEDNKDELHFGKTIRTLDKVKYVYEMTCPVCGKLLRETNESALFFNAIRIIREMREATNNEYPRFIMWENVPGAFHSSKGSDFREVLKEITETDVPIPEGGKWATSGMVELPDRQIAWRVLDAQYWGVPQRRKRIFLVADFAGQCAGKILFEQKSLPGDFAESGEARKGITTDTKTSFDETSGVVGVDGYNQAITGNVSKSMTAASSDYHHVPLVCLHNSAGFMSGQGSKAGGIGYQEEVSPTLKSSSGGNTVPAVITFPNVTGTLCASGAGLSRPAGQCNETDLCIVQFKLLNRAADGELQKSDVGCTLETNANSSRINDPVVYGFNPDNSITAGGVLLENEKLPTLSTTKRLGVLHVLNDQGGSSINVEKADVSPTLRSEAHGNLPIVTFGEQVENKRKQATFCLQGNMIGRDDKNGPMGNGVNKDVAFTLNASDRHAVSYTPSSFAQYREGVGTLKANGGDLGGGSESLVLPDNKMVRRLTPTECARLQGFPDWWTADVPHADTAEYKLWGNGMALPCVFFIMRKMADCLCGELGKEMM